MTSSDPTAITPPIALSFTTRDLVLILFRFRYRALLTFLASEASLSVGSLHPRQ
jgi:hypothetical protein